MAAFDPTSLLISGSNFDIGGLISALTAEMAVKRTTVYESSTGSTSSNSGVSLFSTSVSVEADEIVLFLSQVAVSCGTANDRVGMWHEIDSVNQNNDAIFKQASGTSTAGDQGLLTALSCIIDKSVGSYTFDVKWRNMDASRTIYAAKRNLFVFQLKRR